jgi:hypothetical protein
VTWPVAEGVAVLVAGPLIFLALGAFYGGLLYGAIAALAMLPVLAALWAIHRVLKAWAEWPT